MSPKTRYRALIAVSLLAALAAACVPPPPLAPANRPGSTAGPVAATPAPAPQVQTAMPPQNPTPPATPAQPSGSVPALAGSGWILATLNGKPPVVGTDVTLNFGADGTVSGSDGCNNYNTTYTTDGTKITFKQPIATTMKACPDAIMNQASAYLQALGAAATYGVDGPRLTLFDSAGKLLASFSAQSTDLAGTSWQVLSYNNGKQAVVSVINGTTLTANFSQDGKLGGSAGCNDYSAAYKADGQKIAIGPATSTRKMCAEPQGVMEQEAAYLAAIQTAATYRIDGKNLEMRTADGALAATFAAQSNDLVATNWSVLSYNNGRGGVVSVIIGTNLSADFRFDGNLSGNAGCNDYIASYKADAAKITIGPIAATEKNCSTPEGVMQQEQAYLAALNTVATYKIDGNNMEMRTADGAIAAQFVKVTGGAPAAPTTPASGGTAPAPAAPATPAPSGTATTLQPSQIRLDTQGLPYSWQPVSVPATPYDASQPPGPKGLPQHIEILFGVTKPADRQPGSPIMYIIPVDAYRQMYNAAGNPSVSKTIDQIYQDTYALPMPTPASMPALPYEEITGHNDLAVQLGRAAQNAASASKSGYRFVGRWAQDANPVTNQGLKYVYQGFTNDGRYLVSFFYPVTTKKLPRTAADLTADQMAKFNADPAAAIAADAKMLNSLAPADWDPDLSKLDALVGSLQIVGMTPSGLLDQGWTWAGTESGGGLKPLADPSRTYQVTFQSDGTLMFKVDCNTGSGAFTYNGGATGDLHTKLGPSTLAECNDGGQGQTFLNGVAASQNFQVRPGGTTLGLILPNGGGALVLTNQAP